MKDNINANYTLNGHEITVKSGNIGFVSVFLFLWLFGWSYGGFEAWKVFIGLIMDAGKNPGNAAGIMFFAVWLFGWIAGEILVIYILLWGLLGREIITVSQGVMKIRNDIAGLGWTRVFNVNLIEDMRVNVVVGKKPFDVKADFRSGKKKFGGIGLINFSYEGRTNRFCLSADNKDGEKVLEELKKALPKKAFENV